MKIHGREITEKNHYKRAINDQNVSPEEKNDSCQPMRRKKINELMKQSKSTSF